MSAGEVETKKKDEKTKTQTRNEMNSGAKRNHSFSNRSHVIKSSMMT